MFYGCQPYLVRVQRDRASFDAQSFNHTSFRGPLSDSVFTDLVCTIHFFVVMNRNHHAPHEDCRLVQDSKTYWMTKLRPFSNGFWWFLSAWTVPPGASRYANRALACRQETTAWHVASVQRTLGRIMLRAQMFPIQHIPLLNKTDISKGTTKFDAVWH